MKRYCTRDRFAVDNSNTVKIQPKSAQLHEICPFVRNGTKVVVCSLPIFCDVRAGIFRHCQFRMFTQVPKSSASDSFEHWASWNLHMSSGQFETLNNPRWTSDPP